MRKEGLEHLTLTGYIKNMRSQRKQQVTYLMTLCEQMAEQEKEGC